MLTVRDMGWMGFSVLLLDRCRTKRRMHATKSTTKTIATTVNKDPELLLAGLAVVGDTVAPGSVVLPTSWIGRVGGSVFPNAVGATDPPLVGNVVLAVGDNELLGAVVVEVGAFVPLFVGDVEPVVDGAVDTGALVTSPPSDGDTEPVGCAVGAREVGDEVAPVGCAETIAVGDAASGCSVDVGPTDVGDAL